MGVSIYSALSSQTAHNYRMAVMAEKARQEAALIQQQAMIASIYSPPGANVPRPDAEAETAAEPPSHAPASSSVWDTFQ